MVPGNASDDELVFLLALHGVAGSDAAHADSMVLVIEEIQRRHWPTVWAVADRTLTKYLRLDPTSPRDLDGTCRINLADFTEGTFVWLVNEGAQKYRKHKADPANHGRTFKGWLAVVTRNRLVDHLRSTGVRLISADAGGGDDEKAALLDRLPSAEPAVDEVLTVPMEFIEHLENRELSVSLHDAAQA